MTRLLSQPLGDVALHDALGQALDDGRLAHARLADQHRVVLGAARQHLDHPADLLVAADDRVELALAGQLGEVAAVALERLEGLLGVLGRDPVAAPHVPQGLQQFVVVDADPVGHGQHQVLDGEVLVAHVGALGVGRGQDVTQRPAYRRLPAAEGLGQPAELALEPLADQGGLDADAGEDGPGDALGLVEDGGQQVLGVTSALCAARARSTAALKASWVLSVQRSGLMLIGSSLPPVRGRPPGATGGYGLSHGHQLAPVLAVGDGQRLAGLGPGGLELGRRRATSASSSMTRRTPSRLTPAVGEALDVAQALEVLFAEATAAPFGPAGVEQAHAARRPAGSGGACRSARPPPR